MKGAAYYDGIYRSGVYSISEARAQVVAGLCRGSVVDLGCGEGILGRLYGGRYVGVDFSFQAIGIATERDPHLSDVHRYMRLDFLKEPLPEVEADTVVLGEVLEHLTAAAQHKLLKRITKAYPKARLVATVPEGDSIPDPSHVRTFEREDLLFALLSHYTWATLRRCPKPWLCATASQECALSVALIVKDEEALLEGCLESLRDIWDELVITDTGSTDRTIEIAEEFGARIEHFPWINDFAAARNYCESKCTGNYVYWIDGDERQVEGHDAILEIVAAGKADGVQPVLVLSRSPNGKPARTFARQELLHKLDGRWKWLGAAHNYLEGPGHYIDRRIVAEHFDRPGGDRPNLDDMLGGLRANLGNGFGERHMYYLLRQHWYQKHYQEVIALADLTMMRPPEWPVQRSEIMLTAGHAWKALGDMTKARLAYLRAVAEHGGWAEPYYWLGMLAYEQRDWRAGAAWFAAALPFDPPVSYFTDRSIYDWRRYDQLAVCLYKLGRHGEALLYGAMALNAMPDDPRIKDNFEHYKRAAKRA
jgi:glycosyltransferase involved in cell wall biosynthesis